MTIEKYYVWKDNDHADADGFFDYSDALEFAKEIDADEIEKTCWYDEEAYEDGKPADEFVTIWRKGE